MNMFENLLNSKNCKDDGYYIKNVVVEDIDDDNFLDFASPIKIGFINMDHKAEFLTPTIRTKATKLSIHTYGDNGYEVDDIIRIYEKFYYIEDFVVEVITKGKNKAYHYFINLKWWKKQLMVY